MNGRRLLRPSVFIDVIDSPGRIGRQTKRAPLTITKIFYYLPKDNITGDESHFGDKKSQAKAVDKPCFFCLTY
jgi:hypothetical protein